MDFATQNDSDCGSVLVYQAPPKPGLPGSGDGTCIAALVHSAAGLAGIALLNALLLGFISVLLFRLVRRYTGNDLLSLLFTGISLCGTSIHWLARPHLISWLFLLIFSHIILSAEAGNHKIFWWLPALTILWTNLHGGFFVGIVLLFASAAGEVLDAITQNEKFWAAAFRSLDLTCSARSPAWPRLL